MNQVTEKSFYDNPITGERYFYAATKGEGSYGKALLVRNSRCEEFVLKVQNLRYKAEAEKEVKILNKIKEMKSIGSDSIVHMYNSFETTEEHAIVMEDMDGSLRDYLNTNGPLNLQTTRLVGQQVIRGLLALKQAGYIHCDVKPENVLKSFGFPTTSEVKLCDFGISREVNSSETSTMQTLPYRAPEVFCRTSFLEAADLWSMGILLVELLTGKLPFIHTSSSETIRCIDEHLKGVEKSVEFSGKVAELPGTSDGGACDCADLWDLVNSKKEGYCDEEWNNFVDLLRKLLEIDPSKRVTLEEVLQHPFFPPQGQLLANSPPKKRRRGEEPEHPYKKRCFSGEYQDARSHFQHPFDLNLEPPEAGSDADIPVVESTPNLPQVVFRTPTIPPTLELFPLAPTEDREEEGSPSPRVNTTRFSGV